MLCAVGKMGRIQVEPLLMDRALILPKNIELGQKWLAMKKP